MPHTRVALLAFAAAATLALSACGGSPQPPAAAPTNPTNPTNPATPVTGQVTVFAAASLTDAFGEIGKAFEQANPGTTVQFNFAGSSTLAQQINQGAPADVFASANQAQMDAVVKAANATGEPTVFTENTLQIVVPAGNPAGVQSLQDFGKPELKIALCAEQVPCGAASQQAFQAAGVTPAPDTLEQDVRAVLTKVSLREADAGLVYKTDVRSASAQVEGIDFPEAAQAVNEYPITVLAKAPNAGGGQAFVDYVLSDEGRAVLQQFGFDPPGP
jgi:molybdate transport system substrate-binding protein